MPELHGIISITRDTERAFDCYRESCETADRLTMTVELQDMKKALPEPPPLPSLVIPDSKTSKTSIQLEDSLSKTVPLSTEEPSKVAHIGNNIDPK
jgi:hypothetical protein